MVETLKVLEEQIVKNANNCDLCDYTAASSTALKTHVTKKHNEAHTPPKREKGIHETTTFLILSVCFCQLMKGKNRWLILMKRNS